MPGMSKQSFESENPCYFGMLLQDLHIGEWYKSKVVLIAQVWNDIRYLLTLCQQNRPSFVRSLVDTMRANKVQKIQTFPKVKTEQQDYAPTHPANVIAEVHITDMMLTKHSTQISNIDPAQVQPDDDGLADNDVAITEHEVAQFWSPDDVLIEEERLEKERETRDQDAAELARANQVSQPALLDSKRFSALDALLSKSQMYSQFLTEQMGLVEKQTEAEADAKLAEGKITAGPSKTPAKGSKTPVSAAKKGSKRGRSAAAEEALELAAEKAAAELEVTPTQALLPFIKGELRDYQLKGVKWLISLYQNGINGILADQMGLGKTVQTIGFIGHLRSKGVTGPYLVVGPLSTLSNWVNEFKRFLPDTPVILYHGTRPERESMQKLELKPPTGGRSVGDDFPVIVTSYEIVLADSKFFQRHLFKYIVVDEGHRLKNFNCKLIRELKAIPTNNRLLLTGTPLQNNLTELWSLLNFLMPDLFSSLSDFEGWFDFDSMTVGDKTDKEVAAAEQRGRMVTKLHSILQPFVLRRIKADVMTDLPRKKEIVMYAPMSEAQAKLNKSLLEKTLVDEMILASEQEVGGHRVGSIGKLHNILMQMRKNCNHPDLITSAFTQELQFPSPEEMLEQSGKMALLGQLLTKLHAGGHKVLIFSQMTKMLDLIESYLEQIHHNVCRIDGSVPWQQRQQAIVNFNTDPNTWVFLLSTRAGGLGINLTAADTVIIYDSDWNPSADMQAMDRCHRIGQKKPVLVFRLATANSVEGKMLRRAASKMALERLVIKRGAFKHEAKEDGGKEGSLSASELMDVLSCKVTMDDIPQSGKISDADLDKLFDRRHLELGADATDVPYPAIGVGYEVIAGADDATLLASVNS